MKGDVTEEKLSLKCGRIVALALFVTIGCVDVAPAECPDAVTVVQDERLADGEPCKWHSDCERGVCIPSKTQTNEFNDGFCFSHDWYGCIQVTWPSPFIYTCTDDFERLFVCAGGYPTHLLGDCITTVTGTIGEQYQCCIK